MSTKSSLLRTVLM